MLKTYIKWSLTANIVVSKTYGGPEPTELLRERWDIVVRGPCEY